MAGSIYDRAGGPLTCTGQSGRINSPARAFTYVDLQAGRLAGRVRRIIELPPPDSVSAAISDALPDMFCALHVPGMPLHNSGTERTVRDRKMTRR